MPLLVCEVDAPGAVSGIPGVCAQIHTSHTGSVKPTATHAQLAINMWAVCGMAFADRNTTDNQFIQLFNLLNKN